MTNLLSLIATDEDNRFINVKSAMLLGLTSDSSLSFDRHVENLCNKLAPRIGVLSKITAFLPLKQRLLLYNAIIRPVMSYADISFGRHMTRSYFTES